MNPYHWLAVLTLALHLLFIGWVIFGWLITRYRPLLRWAHILSVLYGVFIETLPLPCPLTLAENHFLQRAGIQPYHQPFLVHYLEAVVYPEVSQALLTWCAVLVCSFILGVYVWRFQHRTADGW